MNRIFVAGITGFALLLCAGLMFDADQAQAGHHHRRGCCGGGGLFAHHRGGCGGGHHRHHARGGNGCCGQQVCCEPAPVCCEPAPSCCGAPAPSCCGQAVSSPCNGCGNVGGAVAGCPNCSNTMDQGGIAVEGGSPSNAPVMQAPQGQPGAPYQG